MLDKHSTRLGFLARGIPVLDQRGAALLLSVYFCCTTLFLVGLLSLQRTNQAMRAAQLSRDLQQAFWLAEAAADEAVARLHREELLDGVEYALTPSAGGTARFTFETLSARHVPGSNGATATQELIRRIEAVGTAASGIQAEVSLVLREAGPLSGVWTSGLVNVHNPTSVPRTLLSGPVQSQLGAIVSRPFRTPGGVSMVWDGITRAQDAGDLRAKLSEDLRSAMQLASYMSGAQWTDDRGVRYLEQEEASAIGPDEHRVDGLEGGVRLTGPSESFPPATQASDIDPTQCGGTLWLPSQGSVTISDGFAQGDIRDLTPAGDGTVTLCVNAVAPIGRIPRIEGFTESPPMAMVTHPTTIYVTGSETVDLSRTILASQSGRVRSRDRVTTGEQLPREGVQNQWDVAVMGHFWTAQEDATGREGAVSLQLVVTEPREPGREAGVVWVQPGPLFTGSIYAPQSTVAFLPRDRGGSDYSVDFVVGRDFMVSVGSRDTLQVGHQQASPEGGRNVTVSLLGWSEGG
jgi:hypothetical protein